MFNVPLTAKVIWSLESHLKNWRRQGSNIGTYGYKVGVLSTTPQQLPYEWIDGRTDRQKK